MIQPFPSRRLSRRRFLGLGAATAGLAIAPGLALSPIGARLAGATQLGDLLVDPPLRRGRNGLLDTSLTPRQGPALLNGRPAQLLAYDESFPGPTLRVRAGDTLRLHLTNGLDEMTNLHVHGLHVSPLDNGDNVFVMIPPGESFQYEFQIPANHPAGTYWYHPHHHGTAEPDVYGGLAGVIIIEGELDDLPGVAGLPERLLILHATEVTEDNVLVPFAQSKSDQLIRTVNGQLNPTIMIRPGETQRWRIANVAADHFFRVQLDGHQFHVIAKDGNALVRPDPVDELILGPGYRYDLLVQGGPPGAYTFRTLPYATGADSTEPEVVLATLFSAGKPLLPAAIPDRLLPLVDLLNRPVDHRREITFNYASGPDFVAEIDGQAFNIDRIDQIGMLGAVEEWVIRNATTDLHPFHIHVNDFITTHVNGQPIPILSAEDTRIVPGNGSITIRTQYTDFPGKWVYHCHILGHEDAGMMGVIQIQEPGVYPATVSTGYGCDLGTV